MSTGELVSIVVSAVFGTFTLMLSLIVWLLRNTYETERANNAKAVERLEKQLAEAISAAKANAESFHKQELTLTKHTERFETVDERTMRLDARDNEQGRDLIKLKERLDRGDRTASGQAPASRPLSREDPTTDPPLAPPRPRLPSRRE
jgi:hypothetical protein